jgi:hypothetical protein
VSKCRWRRWAFGGIAALSVTEFAYFIFWAGDHGGPSVGGALAAAAAAAVGFSGVLLRAGTTRARRKTSDAALILVRVAVVLMGLFVVGLMIGAIITTSRTAG